MVDTCDASIETHTKPWRFARRRTDLRRISADLSSHKNAVADALERSHEGNETHAALASPSKMRVRFVIDAERSTESLQGPSSNTADISERSKSPKPIRSVIKKQTFFTSQHPHGETQSRGQSVAIHLMHFVSKIHRVIERSKDRALRNHPRRRSSSPSSSSPSSSSSSLFSTNLCKKSETLDSLWSKVIRCCDWLAIRWHRILFITLPVVISFGIHSSTPTFYTGKAFMIDGTSNLEAEWKQTPWSLFVNCASTLVFLAIWGPFLWNTCLLLLIYIKSRWQKSRSQITTQDQPSTRYLDISNPNHQSDLFHHFRSVAMTLFDRLCIYTFALVLLLYVPHAIHHLAFQLTSLHNNIHA